MNKKATENYLDKKPVHRDGLRWSIDENGDVTLEIENKGIFNKLAQIIFKKPKISFIHLDEMGNFIWPLIDGEKDIHQLGILVREHFGENAEPLYERLIKYFQILENYKFINWK